MIIETNQSLEAYCKELSKKKIIFIDTEFDRRSTYFSKLSFITISDGKKTNIIDCLEKKLSLSSLQKIISNKKITKVLHGSQQDLEIFKNMKIQYKRHPKKNYKYDGSLLLNAHHYKL